MSTLSRVECDCYIEPDCAAHNKISGNTNANQWAKTAEGSFIAAGSTTKKLPSALYDIITTSRGIVFDEIKIPSDELIMHPLGPAHLIAEEIREFWTKAPIFAKHKLLHKRGYLLYGKPGCGKTSVLHQVIKITTESGGLALTTNNIGLISTGLQILREVEPDRPILCIHEDIDNYSMSRGYESELLSLLDGENHVDHVIHVATTNYLDQISARIRNRPRRFDRVVEIPLPDEQVRYGYFVKKLNLEEKEAKKWTKDTEGFSFAGLTELVISVACLGNSYQKMLAQIKELEKSEEPL